MSNTSRRVDKYPMPAAERARHRRDAVTFFVAFSYVVAAGWMLKELGVSYLVALLLVPVVAVPLMLWIYHRGWLGRRDDR